MRQGAETTKSDGRAGKLKIQYECVTCGDVFDIPVHGVVDRMGRQGWACCRDHAKEYQRNQTGDRETRRQASTVCGNCGRVFRSYRGLDTAVYVIRGTGSRPDHYACCYAYAKAYQRRNQSTDEEEKRPQ